MRHQDPPSERMSQGAYKGFKKFVDNELINIRALITNIL